MTRITIRRNGRQLDQPRLRTQTTFLNANYLVNNSPVTWLRTGMLLMSSSSTFTALSSIQNGRYAIASSGSFLSFLSLTTFQQQGKLSSFWHTLSGRSDCSWNTCSRLISGPGAFLFFIVRTVTASYFLAKNRQYSTHTSLLSSTRMDYSGNNARTVRIKYAQLRFFGLKILNRVTTDPYLVD